MSITIGGTPLASEPAAGGLPVGGTADDVLAGDGTWTPGLEVVGAALQAVPSADLAELVAAGWETEPSLVSEVAGGWMPVDVTSPGTVTVTGGEVVVSIPDASNTPSAGGKESRAWPASGRSFEIIARYQSTGDANAAIEGILRVDYGSAGVGLYAVLKASGAWQVYANFGGAEDAPLLGSLTGLPRDGTGWLRCRIDGARVAVWTGIGVSSTPPVDGAWTLRHDALISTLIGKAAPTALVFGGRVFGAYTVSGATAIKWSQISVRNLGSGG